MDEKRRFSRVRLALPGVLDTPDGSQEVRVEDVSLKGVLLSLERPLPPAAEPGVSFRLRIELATNKEVTMEIGLAHVQAEYAGFTCRRIDLDSLIHLRRLFELNLADPDLLQRELSELGA